MSESKFTREIIVNASVAKVWNALTQPEIMKHWMLDSKVDIATNWEVNSQIIISGDLGGHYFESKGTILACETGKRLSYTLLNSISNLPDVPGSYTRSDFILEQVSKGVRLIITCSNFPTESIYKHFLFYWNGASGALKKLLQ